MPWWLTVWSFVTCLLMIGFFVYVNVVLPKRFKIKSDSDALNAFASLLLISLCWNMNALSKQNVKDAVALENERFENRTYDATVYEPVYDTLTVVHGTDTTKTITFILKNKHKDM